MGVGLDSGLVLDGLADELAALVDEADLAAIESDAEWLGDTLVEIARRMLTIRPFSLDSGLPAGWEATLRAWVHGRDVAAIGANHMKTVEDAFSYKLVWALEAIRTRRLASGWEPEVGAGAAAAAVETGVPSLMAAMLIRAGLPSRRAAIAAIQFGNAAFVELGGMKLWLESEDISRLTAQPAWPTPDTQDLWRRFRDEVLGEAAPNWRVARYLRPIQLQVGQARPPDGDYRLEIDSGTGIAWVVTPDFKRLVRLQHRVTDNHPALYRAVFVAGDDRAHIERVGSGQAAWQPAE